jgi:hypothetical protein
MGRFSRSWSLAKASWAVLRADKKLLALPFISMFATLVAIAGFAVPTFLSGHNVVDPTTGASSFQLRPVGYVLIALGYLVLAYITIFFNTALIWAADQRMRGATPSLGQALGAALSRAGAILPWAIISATVSVILRSAEQRAGLVGRIAIGLVGIAWSLVTFLTLPILVLEGVGAPTALKRSAELFKRTWGENMVANAAIGLVGLAVFLGLAAFVFIVALAGFAPAIIAAVVLAVVVFVCVSLVLSALTVVYQVALYRYATDGATPAAFGGVDLRDSFRPRRRGLFGSGGSASGGGFGGGGWSNDPYGQPGYGQPGYGQPGYGQPGYGQPPSDGGYGMPQPPSDQPGPTPPPGWGPPPGS